MYRYETHLHTFPVSKCAKADVRESLAFYKELGYAGVFITNHFLDGNINVEPSLPYEARIRFYFSDYEAALRIGKELGLAVFCGVEMSYHGTDFLVYGLDKEWYLAHPQIEGMKKSALLQLLDANGALIIHAHPFREAHYIDHIRLFPRYVHGVEIYNANRTDFENKLAEQYADNYRLLPFAGSDNHAAGRQKKLGGIATDTPLTDETDFVSRVKAGSIQLFRRELTEPSAIPGGSN